MWKIDPTNVTSIQDGKSLARIQVGKSLCWSFLNRGKHKLLQCGCGAQYTSNNQHYQNHINNCDEYGNVGIFMATQLHTESTSPVISTISCQNDSNLWDK